MIVSDPWFYVAAVPAVLIYGIGKGGLGGALGVIAIPLVSLVISPTQAAGIFLPILCVMDFFAVKQHYRNTDYNLIKQLLPAAIVGIILSAIFLSYAPEFMLKLFIGIISLWFCGQYLLSKKTQKAGAPNQWKGWFWSMVSGFSSMAIHAGGGPASIYLLPLRLNKVTLIATMAVLFAGMNLVKLVPYALLGELDSTNLLTALVLMPIAPVGVRLGVWLLHRVSQDVVYRLCYFFLFISGMKLLWDGCQPLLG